MSARTATRLAWALWGRGSSRPAQSPSQNADKTIPKNLSAYNRMWEGYRR